MKQIFSTLIVLFFSVVQNAAATEFDFNTILFANWGNKQGQTSLVDIDKDGDLDWVVGQRSNEVSWFEFQSATTWIRHTLGTNALTDVGGVAFDIDGDGWIDQASGGVWYKNPQTPRDGSFTRYTNGAIRTHDNVAADIDGDGKLDLISMNDDTLTWYKIPSDPTSTWIETTVGSSVHGSFTPRGVGDIDGDGDNDIVRTSGWYKNEGNGSSWTWIENISGASDPGGVGQFDDTTRSWIFDIDLDGDNDIVMATADTSASNGWLRWFENQSGDGSAWVSRSIASDKGDLHSLALADFDNDGDIDIFTGEGPLGGSGPSGLRRGFIFENTSGTGDTWVEHIIVEGYEIHEAQAGDVDGDGDIDIVFKPWNGGEQVFLENVTSLPGSDGEYTRIDTGVDISGWSEAEGLWGIESGAIVGQQNPPGSGNGGFLVSDGKYGDFEIVFEVWADWNIDTGLITRADGAGNGYQITIDMQNSSTIAGIYGQGIGGFLVGDFRFGSSESAIVGSPTGFNTSDWLTVWNIDDWNEIRATVQGNPPTIKTWINGFSANSYVGSGDILMPPTGFIALQVHAGNQFPAGKKVRFRNIRVKALTTDLDPPSAPTNLRIEDDPE